MWLQLMLHVALLRKVVWARHSERVWRRQRHVLVGDHATPGKPQMEPAETAHREAAASDYRATPATETSARKH